MYRCCRAGIADISCALRWFKRASLTTPCRRIYRGGISVFTTPQSADVFVASLHEEERSLLREAMRTHDQDIGKWPFLKYRNRNSLSTCMAFGYWHHVFC